MIECTISFSSKCYVHASHFILFLLFYGFCKAGFQLTLYPRRQNLWSKGIWRFGLSGVCSIRTSKAVSDPALGRAAFGVGWQSVPGLTECKGGHSKWLGIAVSHIAQRYCWRITGPWDNVRVVAIAFGDFSLFSIWVINSRHRAKPSSVHPALCRHPVSSRILFFPITFSLPAYLRPLSQILPP